MIVNLAIIFYFWYQSSGAMLYGKPANLYIALGRLAGLMLVSTILLQFLMMGRARFLERVWGLDKLSRLHHWNGIFAVTFLFAHPFFVTLGYAAADQAGFWNQLLTLLRTFENVLPAALAVIIFLAVIITSIIIIRENWNFELFYFIHLSVYLAILIAFNHQFELGGDFIGNPVFRAYWAVLYTTVFGLLICYRLIRPAWLFYRYRFYVQSITGETPNTISIKIGGRGINDFSVDDGQFMIFRFLSRQLWWQAHPFSLSGRGDGWLRITVKAVGDYTTELSNLKVGAKVIIEGPYGIFTLGAAHKNKFLLIAGGIGITPIRSMVYELAEKGRDVILLYGNRTENDIVFFDELKKLKGKHNIQISHILSHEERSGFEKGWIDENKIRRLAPDFKEREIYLCGPPVMMKKLILTFKIMKIAPNRVHYENFSF